MLLNSPCVHCRPSDVDLQENTTHSHSIQADGRIFEIIATPIFNTDGTVSRMEIFRDITEQKKQEERRVQFSRQEEQLKKLDSLKTMAGAIAHRFNNAMMGVQGNLEFMTFRFPVDSDEYRIASQALQSATGASQIGAMMLSYVGQQPIQLRKTSFFNLVTDAVRASNHLFYPEITLKCTPPSQPLYCSVDQQQIQEVIESVLSNAVESMDGDTGSIEITFGSAHFTADSFPVFFQDNTLKDGMYIFCRIKDSGHGISPEDLTQIFEPFYTTRFIGRGLGLALTVGIMRAHQGAVTVESSPNSGTTVKVLLPTIFTTPSGPMPHSDGVGSEPAQFSGQILLADDEEIVRDIGKHMLELLGFTVHTAVNGKQAVAMLCKQKTVFRAAVLDISMPVMNGIEAMKAIRRENPDLPVLLSRGHFKDNAYLKEGKGDNPDAFLSKPFRIDDIRNSLERVLS